MRRVLMLSVIALIAAAASSHADTILVDWSGGGDYETIQEGIDASDTGDTVLVAPGGYFGEGNRGLHFNGKGITLTSTGGRRSTTINADNLDRVFTISQGEGPGTVISGFTIMNGTKEIGGGILCHSTSPTITDCDIMTCTATQSHNGGGGMACEVGGSPTLIDVTFSTCQGEYGGGLISYLNATPSLTRVRFEGNTGYERAGGAYIENPSGEVTIVDCVFLDNSCVSGNGGGLFLFGTSPTVTGATFARNRAYNGGCITLSSGASPTIENSILSFSVNSNALYGYSENEIPTTTRCIVYGNDDGDDLFGTVSDTLNRDPRFCGMLSGDLTLCSNSWALPANNAWGVQMGAYGEGCGDCDTPVEGTSWGAIKALYR